ncbi:MAG: c-type cytochrome biogenesis protein CcmI [Sideroxyarcus sp.]|nr:c-type cytochrome biogenesis protein CcmI [Sideroxyarcus sp.]
MTTFWIISALLLIVAALFVGIPLWRGIARNNTVARDAANLEIYRDQISEMDADLRNGLLTPELHEQGKLELQSRLLDEVHPSEQQSASPQSNPYKTLTIVLVVLLPLASVGLYLQLGSLQAFSQEAAHGGVMAGQAVTDTSLKSLEEKVAESPANPEALLMLARAYSEMGRFSDAARTYDSLTKIVPDEAWIWADYADALAMTHSTLMGAPTKLLEKALKLDPNNLKTLALSGTAAMERGDYAAAVRHWEKLLKLVPPDNADAQMIKDGVHQARQLLAQSKGGKVALEQINEAPVQAAGNERITGTVTLNDSIKSQAHPDDTLFVLVRAAQGPKMPLAIVRKQVKDLPLKFSLDDSMAMSPEMKMSNFDQVVVVARVSKSGNAMPQPGDLMGMSKPLALGSKGISIDIDQSVR